MPLGANLDREVAANCIVLAATREAQIHIFSTACWYDEKDMLDAGIDFVLNARTDTFVRARNSHAMASTPR